MPTSWSVEALFLAGAAWLSSYAIHSSLLLGSVWVLSRRRSLPPGMQDTLWKVALIGGLLTATWQMSGIGGTPLGGRFLLERPAPANAVADLPGIVWLEPASRELPVPGLASPDPGSPVPRSLREDWPRWLLAIWLAGAAAGLGGLLVQRRRLARAVASRRLLERGRARLVLDALCRRARVRHPVRLSTSPRIAGPVALGRREICLPRRALVSLSTEQLENVLAHELAHLVRRDPAWRWVTTVLERVFFFQPLNRTARSRLRDAAEFLCDDWAVRYTGQRLTMAKCLVEVAGWMRSRTAPATGVGMAERSSPLVRRVERLLDGASRPERSRRWGLAWAAVLLAVVLVGSPVITVSPDETAVAPGEVAGIGPGSGWTGRQARHVPLYRMGEEFPAGSATPEPAAELPSAPSGPEPVPGHARAPGPAVTPSPPRAPHAFPQGHRAVRVARPVPRSGAGSPRPPSGFVVPRPPTDVVVFAVETPAEPVRMRLDRLVLELERLSMEWERMGAHGAGTALEAIVRGHGELLPRLIELKETLEISNTFRLEVLAPARFERGRDRVRARLMAGDKQVLELRNVQELHERLRELHQRPEHPAPAARESTLPARI